MRALNLRCDSFPSPSVTDSPHPRLTWALEGGLRQSGYQVQAGSRQEAADLWDSGRVTSGEPAAHYAGKPLKPWNDVQWRVRVWDEGGEVGPWSESAIWNPGKARFPFNGEWIGSPLPQPEKPEEFYEERPAPLLRKEVAVKQGLKQAHIAICAPGFYELRLNGSKVGDSELEPGWTSFAKRVYYSVHDVTHQLHAGQNAVGVMLGNGWWNPLPLLLFGRFNLREALAHGAPCAKVEIHLTYQDGHIETYVSSAEWSCGDGPILRNNVYLGEVYDATREQPGWDGPEFDASHWPSAKVLEGPISDIHTAPLPPIRVRECIPARSITKGEGTYIVDFGQNLAGVVESRFRAPQGTRITLRFCELLHPDGSLNVTTSCACQIKKGVAKGGPGAPETADQRDVYICRADSEEIHTPRFTWHGFRYMEVSGLPYEPKPEDFTALWMNSAVEHAGTFECDDPLLNDIQRISIAALLSNIFSVQSDCPHRERFGYGADIAATTEFAMMNLDMEGFYAKAAQDFADDQSPEGGMPETAPYMGIADRGFGGTTGSVGWGIAHAVLVRDHFRHYGNLEHVRRQYDAMRRYTDFLQKHAPDGIIVDCISDHESVAPLPRSLTATAHHCQQAKITAWAACLLGNQADAESYANRADQIRNAFNHRFYKPDTCAYDIGSQACQAFALYHGLAPEEEEDKVFAHLLETIEHDKRHLSTGIYGTKYILDVLSRRGRADVAYELVTAKGYPGYAYMLENGATTLWESWKKDEFIYSHNHPMFGSVSQWFYHHVAGLAPADDAHGFDKAIVKPNPVGRLRHAAATHRTYRGLYATEWQIKGGWFRLQVTVPIGSTAAVSLPRASSPVEIGPGNHVFTVDLADK